MFIIIKNNLKCFLRNNEIIQHRKDQKNFYKSKIWQIPDKLNLNLIKRLKFVGA